VPFGKPTDIANRIEFHVADVKGYTSTAAYTVHIRLLYLPLVVKKSSPQT
jgi:hypothetical protein